MPLENEKVIVKSKGVPLFRILVFSFSIVAILSCLSIGLLTYTLRASGIREEQYRLLETLRDEKIGNMTDWFRERSGDVKVLVSRNNIRIFCETGGISEAISTDEIEADLTVIKNSYQYESIFLLSLEGTSFAGTDLRPYETENLQLRQEALEQSIRDKREIFTDVLISNAHPKPVIYLFTPIYSTKTAEIVGLLEILIDPYVWLYPLITTSKYLGETGEILLVNSGGVVQSPLKYQERSVTVTTIDAEPANRGAAGETGIIAVDDYRHEPVMAAYGHIDEFNWGIVVKQDVSEINKPVRLMALNVIGVSVGVLILTLLAGILLSKKISRPALIIAETAELIGKDLLHMHVPQEGPAEIQQIAANMNVMVDKLSLQINVTHVINEIIAVAGKHYRISDLLDDVLPLLMEKTNSQGGVVYLRDPARNILNLELALGSNAESLSEQITINPPVHILAKTLLSEDIQIFSDISDINEFFINTHACLSIPLILREIPIGVISLASMYDYDSAVVQISDGIKKSIAQAVEICYSYEQSEKMRRELKVSLKEEIKLKESEKKYRDLFERDSDAIFIYESDTFKIIEANEATSIIYGYNHDELIGMSCLNLFGEDKESDSFAAGIHNNDEEKILNCLHLKKDRSVFFVDISCYEIKLGVQNEKFAVCRDITDRMMAEARMRDINNKLISTQSSLIREEKLASIGRLAAGVAHELNNPIGFINSNFRSLKRYVSLLKDLFEDECFKISEDLKGKYKTDFILEDLVDIMEESNEGFDRIIKIINSLRSFSRVDQNSSFTYFDLNESIKTTLIVAGNEIRFNAHIHTDFGEIPPVYGMAGEVNQVLLNLIVNATQAIGNDISEQMGNIFISTSSDDSYVICRIKDDGIGIKDEDKLKVFDPFYTTNPTGEGTGLGLSISYDIIVNKHKGDLYIENNSSKGAEFVIKLPIVGNGDVKETISY